MPRNPGCSDCALHQMANTRCVWGTGPEHAKIMLVGEAPGAEEDRDGRPFVGQAGNVLSAALAEAGIMRSSVYITNVAKCRPPLNRTPETKEADACLHYLIEEIEAVKPELIVCLGGTAMQTLTGSKKTMAAEHGKLLGLRKGLYTAAAIMATYHPAATLRPEGQRYRPLLVEDLKFARSHVSEEKTETPSNHTKYLIHPDMSEDDAVAAFRHLKDDRLLAVDLEWTSSKDSMIWPWSGRGEIYTISFTARHGDQYVSVATVWPPYGRVRKIVEYLLRTKQLIFHNTMADGFWIRDGGVPDYNLTFDTMLLAYLHDETQILKLEKVAPRYASDLSAGWKGHLFERRPTSHEEWIELLDYNTNDTFATYRALEGISEAIKRLPPDRRDQIVRLNRHLLTPAIPVLQRCSRVGIPIDVQRLEAERKMSMTRREMAAQHLAQIAGTTVQGALALAGSSDKTVEYLHGAYGLELNDAQKDNLSVFADEYPAIRAILDVKKEMKLLSTYLDPWSIMIARQGDKRLHSVYRLTGTRTGRLSAESEMGGSIQVAPRDTEDIAFRQLIRAEDGHLILSADYSQVELRIIAWLANDQTMLQLYREGIDLHKATAAYMIACRNGPVPIEVFWRDRDHWIAQVTKEERQKAKGTNFGLGFGMMPTKLQTYARTNYGVNVTLQEATEMHAGYFRLYSALQPWQDRSMADAARLGYTETVWGRRRSFDPNDVHAAINTPVQSTASDFTLKAMINVSRRFVEEQLDAEIIAFVHDSLTVHVSEKDVGRAQQILLYEMENVDTSVFGFKIPIPLPAEAKVSQTWA